QLLRSMLTELNEQFEEGIRQLSKKYQTFDSNSDHMPLRVIEFVEQNRRLFKAMLGNQNTKGTSNPLHEYLYAITWEHFRQMLQIKNRDALQLEMAAHYYTSAFIGVVM